MTLIERMQELLEAERAGVICCEQMAFLSSDRRRNQLLTHFRNSEGKFCEMLSRLILERGATPSGGIGKFVEKIEAVDDEMGRIALLAKGQAWVVRKIKEIPVEEMNEEEREFFTEMRVAHDRNIEMCQDLLK